MVRLAFAALCAAALAQAVAAYRPGDEVCVVGADNTCPLDKLTPSKTDGSTLVYPGGKTRCAFDDWSSPSNNYSTNATYFFQVFPATPKPAKTKLLLYLQGGGACVEDVTCGFALQCASGAQTFTPNARALSIGVLNRSEPTNLFNDWNIVHLPYCTGDIHVGNAVHSLKDSGLEVIFKRDECMGQNRSSHQNGYENAKAAFEWAHANFPDIDQLALAGSSAGSLGVQMYASYIAEKWQVEEKKIRYSVLADSYVGVVPEAQKPAGQLINYYNACSLPLDIPESVVTKCLNKSGTVVELLSPIVKETSFADWFHFDSKGDKTQRQFYELVRQGILAYPFPDTISAENFYKNVTAILDSYEDDTAKLATWFEEGDRHVFLMLNNYTAIVGADGTKLGTVLSEILDGTYKYANASASGGDAATTPGAASPTTAPSPSSGAGSLQQTAVATVALAVAALATAW